MASVPRSKWGSVDINGKERNSNQAHNWEIKRPIVVEGRRGPLPAQLFPSCPEHCCFLYKRPEKRILSLLTVESVYARSDLCERSFLTWDSAKTALTLNWISYVVQRPVPAQGKSFWTKLQTEQTVDMWQDVTVCPPHASRGQSRQRMWLLPAALPRPTLTETRELLPYLNV